MRLNEQLAQVGRLLAGIVHEIRGPALGDPRQRRDPADALGESSDLPRLPRPDHAQRRGAPAPPRTPDGRRPRRPGAAQATDLGPLVREATDIFRKTIDPRPPAAWPCGSICPPTIPPVRADAGRLIQVLLNLLANAREAIPAEAGGRHRSS